jgi:hypothetical protein
MGLAARPITDGFYLAAITALLVTLVFTLALEGVFLLI